MPSQWACLQRDLITDPVRHGCPPECAKSRKGVLRNQTQVTGGDGSESTLEVPTVIEGRRGSRTRNSQREEKEKDSKLEGRQNRKRVLP